MKENMKRYFPQTVLFTVLLFILASSLNATNTITGTVKADATGDPLPGANILIQGTATGASSDINGHYTIVGGFTPGVPITLVCSYIGYSTLYRTITPVTGTNTLNFWFNPPSAPSASISGTTAVCRNAASPNITFTGSNGTAPYTFTYTINSGSNLVITTTSGNSVTVAVPTTSDGAYTYSLVSVGDQNSTVAVSGSATVTVNPLPATPTITPGGPTTFCAGGSVTLTSSSGTTYLWSNGATTASINVTTTGSYTVQVTNSTGCQSAVSAATAVTVNSLPATPTISASGSTTFCTGGSVNLTSSSGTTYLWSNSATTASINVTTAGNYSVKVTNSSGCLSASSASTAVTVNPLPVPTITGPAAVCAGATGLTYSTEPGMTGYTWTISSGGTITGGANTKDVTVKWNTAGSQTISVNYTNSNGCTATLPSNKAVTVIVLPVPTITGPGTVCAGSTGLIYSTDAGMTGYSWTISSGGTITGGSGTKDITVTWNTSGAQTISVNYTNANSCTAASATNKIVTVNALPAPTITGSAAVCAGTTGVTYSTEAGMTGYMWTISTGGTITGGAGTKDLTVTWNTAGAQTISVNYTNANNCAAISPTNKTVIVNVSPIPTITGSAVVCSGVTGLIYSTEAGMTGYTWTISSGGIITAGDGSKDITVTWNSAGTQTLNVNYTNSSGCTATSLTTKDVTAIVLPVPTITGPAVVCSGTTGVIYSTEAGMTSYLWNISSGGTITAGAGTKDIQVTWNTSGAQSISVNYTNANNCTSNSSTSKSVAVNPVPISPLVGTISQPICALPTGSVVLNGLPSTGTWTLTRTPDGIITTGTGASPTLSGLGTGTYNFTVTNSSGCTSIASSDVVINAQSTTPTAPTIGNITQPDCVTSTGSVILNGLPANGTWTLTVDPGGTTVNGTGTTTTISGLTTGRYNGTVTNSSGCASPASTDIIISTFNIGVIPRIKAKWGNLLICSNLGDSILSYQWYNGNSAIPNAINQFYLTNKQTGNYNVKTSDRNGCKNFSNIISISGTKSVSVYPNPASVSFALKISNVTDGRIVVSILNSSGIKISEYRAENVDDGILKEIPVNNLDEGIYFIQVLVNQKEMYYTKITVIK